MKLSGFPGKSGKIACGVPDFFEYEGGGHSLSRLPQFTLIISCVQPGYLVSFFSILFILQCIIERKFKYTNGTLFIVSGMVSFSQWRP